MERPSADEPGQLDRELAELVDRRVLSRAQADHVRWAADADIRVRGELVPELPPDGRSGVLDVVGYVGGALVLGALIFVGFTLWSDLTHASKLALAIASFIVPAIGGVVLVLSRTRRGLALALLALACLASGFAVHQLVQDEDLVWTAVAVVVCSAVGAIVLRSGVFLLPGWFGAMGLTIAATSTRDDWPEQTISNAIALGWLAVAAVFLATGVVLSRQLAWALAGLSAGAATIPLLAFEHSVLALLLGTAVATALLVGMVRLQYPALAVVGCLIVLGVWPVALYQLIDTALGVALGLVVAGCALIGSAVVLARMRHARERTIR
ncbi:MAG TPA: hypothetical protein VFP34_02860 [Microlunatus sp.]|nr:hypothetical protein [Microlunatus sp.]